ENSLSIAPSTEATQAPIICMAPSPKARCATDGATPAFSAAASTAFSLQPSKIAARAMSGARTGRNSSRVRSLAAIMILQCGPVAAGSGAFFRALRAALDFREDRRADTGKRGIVARGTAGIVRPVGIRTAFQQDPHQFRVAAMDGRNKRGFTGAVGHVDLRALVHQRFDAVVEPELHGQRKGRYAVIVADVGVGLAL